jgi:hypothetical protein
MFKGSHPCIASRTGFLQWRSTHSRSRRGDVPANVRVRAWRGHGFESRRPHHLKFADVVELADTRCFESLPVCHFQIDPFLAELVDALGSSAWDFLVIVYDDDLVRTQCLRTSRFDSGGTDQCCFTHRVTADAGVAEKVNATLKRGRGKAEEATRVISQGTWLRMHRTATSVGR